MQQKRLEAILYDARLGENYYVGKNIPADKLENAVKSFAIPPEENVLALIDTTLFGSAKEGVAFGLRGIYWKNKMVAPLQLSYPEIRTGEFSRGRLINSGAIYIGLNGTKYAIEGLDLPKLNMNAIFSFLHDVKRLIQESAPIECLSDDTQLINYHKTKPHTKNKIQDSAQVRNSSSSPAIASENVERKELQKVDDHTLFAVIACVLFWWAPIISGFACTLFEKQMVKKILRDNNIDKARRLSSKIFWFYRRRHIFLLICTYVPLIGIPCQIADVKMLADFASRCIEMNLDWKTRKLVFSNAVREL